MPPHDPARLAALAPRYEVILCDVWGVLYDGVSLLPNAVDALIRFRAGGGRVVLISNAPVPGHVVVGEIALPREAYDGVVTSGDMTRHVIVEQGSTSVFHIGPDRDLSVFAGLDIARVRPEDASLVVCTGLIDDTTETADDYASILTRCHALGLTLVCSNPDRIVDVGGRMLPCAGVLADAYEALGGTVIWAGKPYGPVYDRALALVGASTIDRSHVLCVGDSVVTDLVGAASIGADALFIASGIHAIEVMPSGVYDPETASIFLAGRGAAVVGSAGLLIW